MPYIVVNTHTNTILVLFACTKQLARKKGYNFVALLLYLLILVSEIGVCYQKLLTLEFNNGEGCFFAFFGCMVMVDGSINFQENPFGGIPILDNSTIKLMQLYNIIMPLYLYTTTDSAQSVFVRLYDCVCTPCGILQKVYCRNSWEWHG